MHLSTANRRRRSRSSSLYNGTSTLKIIIIALIVILIIVVLVAAVLMMMTVMVNLFLLGMLVLVVMMMVFMLHRFLDLDRRFVYLLVYDLLLLDNGRFVMVMNTFCVRMRVLVVLLLYRNVNDDFLLFHMATQ